MLITFSCSSNPDLSLFDGYKYLSKSLTSLIGFPVDIRHSPQAEEHSKPVSRLPDGSLEYRLPDSRRRRLFYSASIPPEAAQHKFCRKPLHDFSRACGYLAKEVKTAWDVKRHIIKEERFIWDNLVLPQSHSGGQRWNALDILYGIRESLSFRYEGQALRHGVIATWNWHELEPHLKKRNCTILPFSKRSDFRETFRKSKMIHTLAEGRNSFLTISPHGLISAIVTFPRNLPASEEPEWQMVPAQFRHRKPVLHGRDLVFATTEHNEIYLFNAKYVLKWSPHSWHRVSGPPLSEIIAGVLPATSAKLLTQVAVGMSFHRFGGLIAVAKNPNRLLAGASKGVAQYLRDLDRLPLNEDSIPAIIRLASMDGCLLISSESKVVSAGLILNVPKEHTSAGEGARAAAASFASTEGIAIKISHDGPITVFQGGRLVRTTG